MSTSSYPDDNPKTVQGEKKIDLSLVPPSAIIAEARVMSLGARKYGPYNWREKTVSTRVYVAAALRHLLTYLDGEDTDPESGESHLAHARACCGIVIDAKSIGKLNDNRPVAGAAGKLLAPIELKAEPMTATKVEEQRTAALQQVETGKQIYDPPGAHEIAHYCAGTHMREYGHAVECEKCKTAIYGPREL